MAKAKKIVIIGGCGHVGLPLGVKFALSGHPTVLVDINDDAVNVVNSGRFPFLEKGGDAQLVQALESGLHASTDKSECRDADVVVFVIGTPVDEHLNPKLSDVFKIFDSYVPEMKNGALIVMRSTLFPGTMEHLSTRLAAANPKIMLAFCPERVSQGYALDEIDTLPQIISSLNDESFEAACDLFARIAPTIIRLTPLEAEMTKLMANSWRYLEFAIANQFYMIAEENGVDFYKIFNAIRYDYPRAQGYKSPGFAAGPCLFKDTMQLASYFDNNFAMGHSAMLVNEGLADFVVEKVAKKFDDDLWGRTIGLLGMAFKGDNDDIRESLSFKVKKGLEFRGATVLCADPFVPGDWLHSVDELESRSDILVLCTPHSEYRKLKLSKACIDIWGIYETTPLEIYPGTVDLEKKVENG